MPESVSANRCPVDRLQPADEGIAENEYLSGVSDGGVQDTPQTLKTEHLQLPVVGAPQNEA